MQWSFRISIQLYISLYALWRKESKYVPKVLFIATRFSCHNYTRYDVLLKENCFCNTTEFRLQISLSVEDIEQFNNARQENTKFLTVLLITFMSIPCTP